MKTHFLAALALAAASTLACAQQYPDKPVKIIVPFAPGGGTDIIARLFAQRLATQLNQAMVVENRTGGGGSVGTDALAKSVPDGYTIGFCGVSTTIAPAVYKTLAYDLQRDLIGIAGLTSGDNIVMVPASSPARNVLELVALLKSKGTKANYASAAVGGSTHMATEVFQAVAGTSALHIPFRGSAPALVELMAGRADMMFDNIPAGLPHIRAGTLRALASTGTQRNSSLPDLPTFKELGMDVGVTSWTALCAPTGTPKRVIDRMAAEITKAQKDPELRARLTEMGQNTLELNPAQLLVHMNGEMARWKRIAESGNIKLD